MYGREENKIEGILRKHPELIHEVKPQCYRPVLYEIAKIPNEESCLIMLRKLATLKVDFRYTNNWGLIMELAMEGRNSSVVELIE